MNQQSVKFDVRKSPTDGFASSALVILCSNTSQVFCLLVLSFLALVVGTFTLFKSQLLSSMYPVIFFVGVLVSLFGAWVVTKTEHIHGHLTMDSDLSGVQKSHTKPVPRIGAISIVLGLLVLWAIFSFFSQSTRGGRSIEFYRTFSILGLCSLPALFAGVVEDLTKKVSVLTRLIATIISGLLAAYFADSVIFRLDVPILDIFMSIGPIAILVCAIAVGGISNAVNIIDGLNGLASGSLVVVCAGFALISAKLGDPVLVLMSLSVMSVCLGFMFINYPNGHIFLGDGGAYLLGFCIGEMALLMLARHPDVSCWTVLTLIAYPVVEVVVSVIRRKINKTSAGAPDRGHLHQQLQLLIKLNLSKYSMAYLPVVNGQVGPLIWVFNLICVVCAIVFAQTFSFSVIGYFVAASLYIGLYLVVRRLNQFVTNSKTVFTGLLEVMPVEEMGLIGNFDIGATQNELNKSENFTTNVVVKKSTRLRKAL